MRTLEKMALFSSWKIPSSRFHRAGRVFGPSLVTFKDVSESERRGCERSIATGAIVGCLRVRDSSIVHTSAQ